MCHGVSITTVRLRRCEKVTAGSRSPEAFQGCTTEADIVNFGLGTTEPCMIGDSESIKHDNQKSYPTGQEPTIHSTLSHRCTCKLKLALERLCSTGSDQPSRRLPLLLLFSYSSFPTTSARFTTLYTTQFYHHLETRTRSAFERSHTCAIFD